MKRKVFITILMLIFCFPAFAISPFATYGPVSWNTERAFLDNLAVELLTHKDEWVSIRIHLDKKSSKDKARKRLNKMFSYLTTAQGKTWSIEKSRISFAIFEEKDREQTSYWVFDSTAEDSDCGNCQWIKGEDFEQKISKLFIKK